MDRHQPRMVGVPGTTAYCGLLILDPGRMVLVTRRPTPFSGVGTTGSYRKHDGYPAQTVIPYGWIHSVFPWGSGTLSTAEWQSTKCVGFMPMRLSCSSWIPGSCQSVVLMLSPASSNCS